MTPRKISLPQANNLDTVIDVASYLYGFPGSSMEQVAEYIGFTRRQAQYYTFACEYLGLIDENCMPTTLCNRIMAKGGLNKTEGVYECVLNDEVMGRVFARLALFPECDIDQYALSIASIYFPELAENSTLVRRCHGIVLWCKKILEYITMNHQK